MRKLVANFGYPAELLHLSFDWQYMMRGLTIDKIRGNVIKARPLSARRPAGVHKLRQALPVITTQHQRTGTHYRW